jgi:phage terminase small subunit
MAATGDPTYSAAKAGYPRAAQDGWIKANNPALMETVRRAQLARLNNDLLPAALNLIEKVILDDKETTRNRLTAAKIVVDRTIGMTQDGAETKEPHEMTAAELQERIERLRREQSERAKPIIDAEPAPDPNVFD